MRTTLRWLAAGLAFCSLAFWFFGGPNLGWTKTSVALPQKDPVTEQEYVVWEKRFLPGVDFLAAAWAVAAIAFGASFLIPKQPSTPAVP
jgi:hypothetical protein